MNSFASVAFWLYFLYFFISVFVAFFMPGSIFLRQFSLTNFQKVVLSLILGMVLWALQGFIFGFLQIRFATYLYLLIFFVLWLKTVRFGLLRNCNKWFDDRIAWSVIVLGTLVQMIAVWFIGFWRGENFVICCFWPDDLYHLAMTNSLVKSIPPIEPGMAGTIVHNYHYLGNLVIAEMIRVFHLPLINTHYQYVTLFISLLLGMGVLVFAQLLNISRSFNRWLLFFIFFSGDIIFLLLLLLGKGFDFSLNVSENATSLWFSPPRVFAMVILFGGLSMFLYWISKKKRSAGMIAAVLFASLVGFKIYIGFFIVFGLAVLGIYFLMKRRIDMIWPLIATALIGLGIYFPVNQGAGGFIFTGLWRIEDFAVRPAFGFHRFELARQIFLQHKNYLRVSLIEVFYFVLYIFSLFGMFFLGFVQSKKSIKKFPIELHLVLLSGLVASLILGLFFIQQTGGANTSQFLFSVYLAGSMYAALACCYWLANIRNKKVVIILVALITILVSARVLYETKSNIVDLITEHDEFVVTEEMQQTYAFIDRNIKAGDLLAIDPEISQENTCYALSLFAETTPFLCGEGILADHGVNITKRHEINTRLFTSHDPNEINRIIHDNGISAVYVTKTDKNEILSSLPFFKQVFENQNVRIFRVKHE